MPLLLLFIVVPIVELYFLIKVGSIIGVIPTILIVIGTAVLGTALLRQQGLATLNRYQQSLAQGKVPAQELVEGLALVVGGVLLLTPGFVTDTLGFLCLIPLTRQAVVRWLMKRVRMSGFSVMQRRSSMQWNDMEDHGGDGRHEGHAGGRTIEGEFRVKDKDKPR